jgi:hypothetical protein
MWDPPGLKLNLSGILHRSVLAFPRQYVYPGIPDPDFNKILTFYFWWYQINPNVKKNLKDIKKEK